LVDHPLVLDSTKAQAYVRILETTDLHVHMMRYDYYTDQPAPHLGMARTASLVRAMRAEVQHSLLFDNGDFLQGNPLSDWVAHESGFKKGDLHPMIAAMNALDYDGATLGNHEFNYGLDFLENVMDRAKFPIVSANIMRQTDGVAVKTLVPPFAILDRALRTADGGTHLLRVGIIGFAPPQITEWERLHLKGRIATVNIVAAARACVPQLRAAGADLVIALSHSGIGPDDHSEGMENASVPLAAVEGIDVVLTGHTHLLFPGSGVRATAAVDPVAGTLHGKPAVMAGFHGSHLGVIDLLLERDADGWRRLGHVVRVLPIAQWNRKNRAIPLVKMDARVVASARAAHRSVIQRIRRPVGHSAIPLHSHFALVAADATLQLVADAQRDHVRAALAGTEWADLPILSAAAPFKAGGRGGCDNYVDIPAGPLALRHAAELYVYPNSLCAIDLLGADLRDWLERTAGLFLEVTPGLTRQPLIDPAFPSYNFDVIDGLTYTIDPSRPSRFAADGALRDPLAWRISDVRLGAVPLRDTERVILVTNSYRAGGGGAFAAARRGKIVYAGKAATRDIIQRHIETVQPLGPHLRNTWRFASLPDTAAQFESGRGALAHLPSVADRHIVDAGPGQMGFRQFTLSFNGPHLKQA
jgi:2',3'-cyclic-nucleotide 2'-phosphodiesterase / 3'-nucleotidase